VMDLHHLLLAGLPAHSGLPRSTDIIRPARHVRAVPGVDSGGVAGPLYARGRCPSSVSIKENKFVDGTTIVIQH
jgi:hypothetical protein